jgi:hypothetical protein
LKEDDLSRRDPHAGPRLGEALELDVSSDERLRSLPGLIPRGARDGASLPNAFELRQEGARIRVAAVGVVLDESVNQLGERLETRGPRDRPCGEVSRHALQEDSPKPMEVRASVHVRWSTQLLRGCIRRCTGSAHSVAHPLDGRGEPEIDESDAAAGLKDDVAWLDVSVNETDVVDGALATWLATVSASPSGISPRARRSASVSPSTSSMTR